MKIVLDIDKLFAEGHITEEEYTRLKQFAVEDTSYLAFNVLVGFGVVATAVGALALVASAIAAVCLGLILTVVGIYLRTRHREEWGLLSAMLLLVGAIIAAGGIIDLYKGEVGFLIATFLFLLTSILTRSNLLAIMSALSLSATIGAMTAYGGATYVLSIQQPTLTVVLFSLLGIITYQLSKRLSLDYQPIAITFSRTSLFLVNLGFWVGSLWGDSLWYKRNDWDFNSRQVIPDWGFAIVWALGLIATGVWAARNNKRWVVNLLTVFGSIHFYTQYFEHLGASPGSIFLAGIIALGIAIAIIIYNRNWRTSTTSHN